MKEALIIVDVQRDFCAGGALAIPSADEIVPVINALMQSFDVVIATRDWHPVENSYSWPDHCIQNTVGADYHSDLNVARITQEFLKGEELDIHPYGAFYADNERGKLLKLHGWLQKHAITHLFVVGLATDYCVLTTVLDALYLGYNVTLIKNACRALVDADGKAALEKMLAAGAVVEEASHLLSDLGG